MWVNLSSDTGMGWTFTFTLAAWHAWQSLHQASMSLDMPCQPTFLHSSPLVACGPGWAVSTCLAMPGSPTGSGHSRPDSSCLFLTSSCAFFSSFRQLKQSLPPPFLQPPSRALPPPLTASFTAALGENSSSSTAATAEGCWLVLWQLTPAR